MLGFIVYIIFQLPWMLVTNFFADFGYSNRVLQRNFIEAFPPLVRSHQLYINDPEENKQFDFINFDYKK